MDSVHEQSASELPTCKRVTLRLKNLRLHSFGVFSNVYRGTLLSPAPRREIAIKKTWPDTNIRDSRKNMEVEILLKLQHKNIIRVLYLFRSVAPDKKVCESLVFDFLPSTLAHLIKELGGRNPNLLDIKLYTWQLFNGLYYLTHRHICHRDIKPQNLLVEPQAGLLKIADFGSAKVLHRGTISKSYQVTRFYRPPELLMQATKYTTAVDVWSGGCVLGEMLKGGILFPGTNAKRQLKLIVNTLGSPNADELREMKVNVRFEGDRVAPKGFEMIIPHAPHDALAILKKILVYRPRTRLCGKTLLRDPFFEELFTHHKKRSNGSLISNVLSTKDLPKSKGKTRQDGERSRNDLIAIQGEVSSSMEPSAQNMEQSSGQNMEPSASLPANLQNI